MAVGALSLSAVPAAAKKVKVPQSEMPAPESTAPESLAYHLDEFPYRIAPGDELLVDFGVQIFDKQVQSAVVVRPDGMITLNPVGDLRAAGLTPSELDSTLNRSYVGIYKVPLITVAVTRVAGNLVHVLGQVERPGSYPVNPNGTVLQSIAAAGGFTDRASTGSVLLMRRTGMSSLAARKLQLDRALGQGISSQDAFVRRYDIIYVPSTTISRIDKFVDQFFAKTIPISQSYIQGWEAFHMDRVFGGRATVVK